VNGELITEGPASVLLALPVNGLSISGEVTDASGAILMDELRISSGTRYTGAFTPERNLAVDDSTVAYLPLERRPGLMVHNEVTGEESAYAGGQWVTLADDAAGVKLIKELILPTELLDAFAAENGERARRELLDRWKAMDDEAKRQFLAELGLL
jgi:hypothetical protein